MSFSTGLVHVPAETLVAPQALCQQQSLKFIGTGSQVFATANQVVTYWVMPIALEAIMLPYVSQYADAPMS